MELITISICYPVGKNEKKNIYTGRPELIFSGRVGKSALNGDRIESLDVLDRVRKSPQAIAENRKRKAAGSDVMW